ncbi:MAG: hemerythrin family protein [Rhodospirillales bacterium]
MALSSSTLTGHEVIDDEHLHIAGTVNNLAEAVAEERFEDCIALTGDFADRMLSHFDSEEGVLGELGYPDLEDHRDLHNGFKDRLDKFKDEARAAPPNRQDWETFCKKLAAFFIDEAIGADMDFKSFLIEMVTVQPAS